MSVATLEHVRAYDAVTAEIIVMRSVLTAFGINAAALVQYNAAAGNIDGAASSGLVALNRLTAEFNRLMDGFQAAVADLMGERPHPGESAVDFFGRIYSMDAEGWFEMAKRNGITLSFRPAAGASEKA